MAPRQRGARLVPAALALGIGLVLTTASPAWGHGAGGLGPTNYQTRVLGMSPRVRGVSVGTTDLGTRLELTNTTRTDVVVLGYDDEPYLRVGPRGTFVNTRSPARYLNRTLRATTPVPASADSSAPPRWQRTGSDTTVRWHDHRTHWMGSSDPPIVQRDRGATHLIQRWTVKLVRGNTTIRIVGDVRWVPGPSPWPWLAASFLLGGVAFVGTRARHWPRVLGVAVVVVMTAQIVHVLGGWDASTASTGARLGANVYELLGIVVGVAALFTLLRRGGSDAAPLLFIGGVVAFIGGGIAEIAVLSHSQLPTTLPSLIDRVAIAVSIGGAAALAAGAALHLHPPAPGVPRSRGVAQVPADRALAAMATRHSTTGQSAEDR